ncbi:MAG: hypothetical protein KKE73_06870 [Proteobacteria bacterium]|nr:hypothetical protein [Pseudomonadota bacterium]
MKKYKVFILTRDVSPEAEGKHPSETEKMISYDMETETGEEAVSKARARFDLEHGNPNIHVEGVSVLEM